MVDTETTRFKRDVLAKGSKDKVNSCAIFLMAKKVVIGQVTCSGRNQARKFGENCYSFSIPFWFALR